MQEQTVFDLSVAATLDLPPDFFDARPNAFHTWSQTLMQASRQNLLEEHQVAPVLAYLRPKYGHEGYQQVLLDLGAQWQSKETQQVFAQYLPQVLAHERAICAMTIVEAWRYTDDPERFLQVQRRYRRLVELPRASRQEVLCFRFETPAHAWTKYLVFKRHRGTRPRILGEEQAVDGYTYSGAFMRVSHFLYQPVPLWRTH